LILIGFFDNIVSKKQAYPSCVQST